MFDLPLLGLRFLQSQGDFRRGSLDGIAQTQTLPMLTQFGGELLHFAAKLLPVRVGLAPRRVQKCAPPGEDIHLVLGRSGKGFYVGFGMQMVVAEKVILLLIAVKFSQLIQHNAAHPARRFTRFDLAQQVQITKQQRAEAAQFFSLFRRTAVRERRVFFPPLKLLALRLDGFDVLQHLPAPGGDALRNTLGRVILAQAP